MAVQVRQIGPGYLRAMGIPVLRGRDVLDSDADVLLVSQDAAKLYWGADEAIGRRATLPALSRTALRQVVGIVGDVKQRNLIEGSTPTVYFYTREPYGSATFAIRTSVPTATLAQPAIAAIRAIDPEQPVGEVQTMEQVLGKVDKTIVETGNVTPYLPLPEFQKKAAAKSEAVTVTGKKP